MRHLASKSPRFRPKSFCSVQRKLNPLLLLEAQWVFQWSGHWWSHRVKRIQLPPKQNGDHVDPFARRCQTGESHSNCRVFFWGRQLRDFNCGGFRWWFQTFLFLHPPSWGSWGQWSLSNLLIFFKLHKMPKHFIFLRYPESMCQNQFWIFTEMRYKQKLGQKISPDQVKSWSLEFRFCNWSQELWILSRLGGCHLCVLETSFSSLPNKEIRVSG